MVWRSDFALGLVRVAGLATLASVSTACAGAQSASYTRWRRQTEHGELVSAEEVRASEFIAYHAQADAPRPVMVDGIASSGVGVQAEVGNPRLPPGSAEPVLQITLRGAAGVARAPATIVVCIDLSGSMNEGDKIGAVRHALARLVETLDPNDRIGIVTFAQGADVVLAPAPVATRREAIQRAIGWLEASGGTNLEAGLRTALAQALASRQRTGTTRVVLLSDGVATVGITDRAVITGHAAAFARAGISLTAIGLGAEIDDALLSELAHQTEGQYHYLDRPAEVERVFAQELRTLTESAVRDVEVHLSLPAGWSLARAYDDRTSERPGEIVTRVGELGGDEAKVILYELRAPPAAIAAPEALRVEARFTPPAGGSLVVASTQVAVTRDGALPYDAAPGGAILRNLALGRTALALREADIRRRGGDVAGAASTLRVALAQLCAARARLSRSGGASIDATLAEPATLLGRTLAMIDARGAGGGSAAWSVWTAQPGSTARTTETYGCDGLAVSD